MKGFIRIHSVIDGNEQLLALSAITQVGINPQFGSGALICTNCVVQDEHGQWVPASVPCAETYEKVVELMEEASS